MGRPTNVIPSKYLNVAIPLPTYTKLTFAVHSDLEGRVPLGAYSRFLTDLLERHFSDETFDLSECLPELSAGVHLVRGDPATIAILRKALS